MVDQGFCQRLRIAARIAGGEQDFEDFVIRQVFGSALQQAVLQTRAVLEIMRLEADRIREFAMRPLFRGISVVSDYSVTGEPASSRAGPRPCVAARPSHKPRQKSRCRAPPQLRSAVPPNRG